MKKFLSRFLLFVGLMALLMCSLALIPLNKDNYLLEQENKNGLLQQISSPRIILLGGSNCAFGYDSKMLSDSTCLPVINMGLHAGLGLKFILDNYLQYAQPEDIVVLSPEYDHFINNGAYGEKSLADLFWEQPCKYVSHMNSYQLCVIFKNTPACIKEKFRYFFFADKIMGESIYVRHSFNEYGDVVAHWNKSNTYKSSDVGVEYQETPKVNRNFICYFAQMMKKMNENNIHVVFYPPVISKSAYLNEKDDIESIVSALEHDSVPFMCPVMDFVYEDSLFFDTKYHLNKNGVQKRTMQIVNMLGSDGINSGRD